MGIHALPSTTVRTLGVSQVLTDPAAVVKELIDNALDANATSISIEITSITLDSIQVRDNGHGIPPEDRPLVAKPHCTSKITNEEDVRTIGGTSLGFRGEAIASMAEMSTSLTISTKVEGEPVAVALKINRQGEVVSQERASLPVGTTVKITNFMETFAVRKQAALKDSEKCLKRIKSTLQSYAFARPSARLSVRVLKAKNNKGDWTYAPKPGGNAEDAAFKIVGAACASQCTWSVVEDHGFTLQAFLPRVDAEAGKIANHGSFVSIDARPVTTARGTPKQIIKSFREALKKANAGFDGIKEPFIYLDIACPLASYDANVEPAKDDVLFEDPNILINAARRLFDATYSVDVTATPTEVGVDNRMATRTQQLLSAEDGLDASVESPLRDHVQPPASAEEATEPTTQQQTLDWLSSVDQDAEMPEEAQTDRRRAFRSNMYGCDEEDLDLMDARPPTGRTEADFEELRQARDDVNVSNPWVMAKMNAPLRRPRTALDNEEQSALSQREMAPPTSSPTKRKRPLIDLEATGLPTPRPSSPSMLYEGFHASDYGRDVHLTRDGQLVGSQSLPQPESHMTSTSTPHGEPIEPEHMQHARQMPAYDYTLSSQTADPPTGTPLQAIPDAGARPRRGARKPMQQPNFNKPFVQPMRNEPPQERVWFDHLEGSRERRQPTTRRTPQARNNNGLVIQGELGDLIDEPRPLTPPRRNRDMRDFVATVHRDTEHSAASLIESRNFTERGHRQSMEGNRSQPAEPDDENTVPAQGVLGARGFIPASELTALEAHIASSNKDTARPSKRRKTGEGRALRQISSNSRVRDVDDDEDCREGPTSRAGSRRRRTTDGGQGKLRRSKSSRLPLEHVPSGCGTHRLTLNLPTSIAAVSRSAGKIDEDRSLLSWNEPAVDAYDTFAVRPSQDAVQGLATKLGELLLSRVSDGEIVQDLGLLVQNAFAAHEQGTLDIEQTPSA